MGHECRVVAREKDVALDLLKGHGIEYTVLAPIGKGLLGIGRELLVREMAMVRLCRKFRPDLLTGTSANAARVAKYLGAKSVIVSEDDAKVVPLFRWIGYPFASLIVTPAALAFENHGPRHFTYPGYHELYYLHPDRYSPDRSIFEALGIARDSPYAIVRLSALQAHHDSGVRGVSEQLLRRVIDLLRGSIQLFISSEKPLAEEFERFRIPIAPERMHDAMAFAQFVLGDSQTMTAEAAVLGVPAFWLTDLVGRLSYLRELMDYGLVFGFKPGQEDELFAALEGLLADRDRKPEFERRRRKMLAERIDPLSWFVELCDLLVQGSSYDEMHRAMDNKI